MVGDDGTGGKLFIFILLLDVWLDPNDPNDPMLLYGLRGCRGLNDGLMYVPLVPGIGNIGVKTGVVEISGICGSLLIGALGEVSTVLTVPSGITVRGDVK